MSGDPSGGAPIDAADTGEPEGSARMDGRIREYWEWITVALFLFTTVDIITSVYAARAVGVGAEANPIVGWTLTHGPLALAGVNLAVVVLVVTLFWGLMAMLERTPAPIDRWFAIVIELWLALVLTVGFVIFANNLVVIFFEESLL